MWKGALIATILAGVAVPAAPPAQAGERYHGHRTQVIYRYHEGMQRPPWYRQPPWIGTGVGHYYSYHPDHVPGYPHELTGYPIPIFRMSDSDPVVRAFRGAPSAHVDWCRSRYRSYDMRSDTYQPYEGPRRFCMSPFR